MWYGLNTSAYGLNWQRSSIVQRRLVALMCVPRAIHQVVSVLVGRLRFNSSITLTRKTYLPRAVEEIVLDVAQ